MGTYNKLMIMCEELKELGGVIERKLHSMGHHKRPENYAYCKKKNIISVG